MKVSIFSGADCPKSHEGVYLPLAYKTGELLARAGFTVITGAGPGLMDAALRGASEAGGDTIGIILNLPGRTNSVYAKERTIFDKLGPRQDKMIGMADAYMALPGGVGTMYEIYNILALKRINQLSQETPLILIGDFYKDFPTSLAASVDAGFLGKEIFDWFTIVATPEEAVALMLKKLNK